MVERTQVSPWFPISTPPKRVGVYNVSCCNENQTGNWYSYWDGKRFNYYAPTTIGAIQLLELRGCGIGTKTWRGLSTKPETTTRNTHPYGVAKQNK